MPAAERLPAVECLMSPLEPLCYEVVSRFLEHGARAAEVGSYSGGSACILWHAMRRGGKDVVLACHDLFRPFEIDGERRDIEPIFDANTEAWGVRALKVKGDSKVTHAIHQDGSLDYCFIDGDHSFEGALADIRNFLPKLKPGGWLVIQDCIGDVVRAAEAANLGGAGMHMLHIPPPYGHHVLVCHRDKAALAAYEDLLRQAISAAGPLMARG